MRVVSDDGSPPRSAPGYVVSAPSSRDDGMNGGAQAGLAWNRRISGTVYDGVYEYLWHFPGSFITPGAYTVHEVGLFTGTGTQGVCRPAAGRESVSFVVPPPS
jgi:hypothetical protein